ncbi:MAG: F0F1 ATP synthase subunit B [Ruminiclostridium sp.]|nr:F0F1 ATP synthase subunit B [Ruminiclostridium sp.]
MRMGINLLAGETLELVNINTDTIIFTLINTLIIFLLYFFFLHKPVMKILDERKEKINSEMKAAEDAQAEAESVKAEYDAKLKESKEEAAQIVSAAVKRAGERENQIIAEAQQEAAAMKQKAEESIELEKKKAINEIKDQISDIVIMASEKVCEKEISKSDNEALINKFIAEVGNE